MAVYFIGYLRIGIENSLSVDEAAVSINQAKDFVLESLLVELVFTNTITPQGLINILAALYMATNSLFQPQIYLLVPQFLGEESAIAGLDRANVVFEVDDRVDSVLSGTWAFNKDIIRLSTPLGECVQVPHIPLSTFVPNQFPRTGLGGTFDHIHIGHKLFLTTVALATEQHTLIGITSGDLLRNKKFSKAVSSYEIRENSVKLFLNILKPTLSVETFILTDPIGRAGTESKLSALVFTTEVAAAFSIVNETRLANGLREVEAVELGLIEEGEEKLSSTMIREAQLQAAEGNYIESMSDFLELGQRIGVAVVQMHRWWEILSRQYLSQNKFYHSLHRVYAMIRSLQKSPYESSPMLLLTIWFHDAIRRHGRGIPPEYNQVANKNLLHEFLTETRLLPFYKQAETYILSTSTYIPQTSDLTERIFIDLALHTLSEVPAVYSNYTAQLRREYSSQQEFASARRTFILSLLSRESIYYTPYFQSQEAQARNNLQAELNSLEPFSN